MVRQRKSSGEIALEWLDSAREVEKPPWNGQTAQVKWRNRRGMVRQRKSSRETPSENGQTEQVKWRNPLGMVRQRKSSGETALEWSDSASHVEKPPWNG